MMRYFAIFWWVCLFAVIGFSLAFSTQKPPDLAAILQMPSALHWMGTDSMGRDLFWRLVNGAKISLMIGLGASVIAVGLGGLLGMIAGMSSVENRSRFQWRDHLIMRVSDIFLALPGFVLVSLFILLCQGFVQTASLAVEMLVLSFALGGTHWMQPMRVTRGKVIETCVQPYIEAARAIGANDQQILWRHILPHLRSVWVNLFIISVPAQMMYESSLSFLGLGVQPPDASWGVLLNEGWKTLSVYPHLMLFPCLVIFLTIWSLQIFARGKIHH